MIRLHIVLGTAQVQDQVVWPSHCVDYDAHNGVPQASKW